jgi:HEAT repeat protein
MLAGKFVALLEDAHPGVRGAAATSLVRLGPTAVASLEKALEKPSLRTLAMVLLAATGSSAKPAVDTLVKALADADPSVRGDAAVAIASIGPDAAEAVPALSQLLGGGADEAPLRYAAAYALGRIGPASAPAAETLRGLAKSEDELMASVAIWALLKIEPENKSQAEAAVPVLRKALRGPRDLARLEAAAALGDLGSMASSAVPILELVSEDDPLPAVRKAAAESLAKIKAAR